MLKTDWDLDFNDNRTSLIEKVLVYLGIACVFIGTICEIIQVAIALS